MHGCVYEHVYVSVQTYMCVHTAYVSKICMPVSMRYMRAVSHLNFSR